MKSIPVERERELIEIAGKVVDEAQFKFTPKYPHVIDNVKEFIFIEAVKKSNHREGVTDITERMVLKKWINFIFEERENDLFVP